MFFSKQHSWIGFDVGASCVKVAQLAMKNGRPRLKGAAIVPRCSSPISSDSPNSVRHEIESALATIGKLETRRCAGVLSMSQCDVAAGDVADVKEQLATPQPCRQSWLADSSSKEELWYTLEVSVSAAEQLCDDFLSTGLSCRTLDATPHTLSRAVALAASHDHGKALGLLDWSHSGAMYCSVINGKPAYVRQLRNAALGTLEEDLCEELDINRGDLYRLLCHSDSELLELVNELVQPITEQLGLELARTLEHLRFQRKSLAPRKVYLFGGGGALRQERQLSEKADCLLEPWKLPHDETTRVAPDCMLASAIALSGLPWEAR